jgi:hypothetical protein
LHSAASFSCDVPPGTHEYNFCFTLLHTIDALASSFHQFVFLVFGLWDLEKISHFAQFAPLCRCAPSPLSRRLSLRQHRCMRVGRHAEVNVVNHHAHT